MTPKEKARELAYGFYNGIVKNTVTAIGKDDAAKQCALIAVDEIIGAVLCVIGSQKHFWKSGEKEEHDYWQSVKSEIEKL
ncbi:MAG TPA: hypothetical protein PKV73_01275 [Agriterribacter sp.]|nr:hypothetical protein [Agriterribacter sp.]